jgi:hypothetical protein
VINSLYCRPFATTLSTTAAERTWKMKLIPIFIYIRPQKHEKSYYASDINEYILLKRTTRTGWFPHFTERIPASYAEKYQTTADDFRNNGTIASFPENPAAPMVLQPI